MGWLRRTPSAETGAPPPTDLPTANAPDAPNVAPKKVRSFFGRQPPPPPADSSSDDEEGAPRQPKPPALPPVLKSSSQRSLPSSSSPTPLPADAPLPVRLAAVTLELDTLKQQLSAERSRLQNGGLSDCRVGAGRQRMGPTPKRRRVLQGHLGRVYAVDWDGEGQRIVSAGQDNHLLLWSATTRAKQSIPLRTHWVMCCAVERKSSLLVGLGGMDNKVGLYSLPEGVGKGEAPAPAPPLRTLVGHESYISVVKFLTPDILLSGSGDATLSLWDVSTGNRTGWFSEHASDVLAADGHPTNPNIFVSGAADGTSRVWDTRTDRSASTFTGHDGDVTCVSFLPSGLAFGSGGEDGSVKLFDMRSCAKFNDCGGGLGAEGVTSLQASRSGRLLFAGMAKGRLLAWDSLDENSDAPVFVCPGHLDKVAGLSLAPAGHTLASASWDHDVSVWG